MGSTGEPDRKRRLSSSFAPGANAVAPAKRPALPPCSDDKKLDFAVLKYRNQKLSEQLEVHKFEYRALEGKFDDLKQGQKAQNETLDLVNKSWEHLVRYLEITSVCKSGSQNSACSTECSRQLRITATELSLDRNDAIQALSDLHLKHWQLTENYHNQGYSNARSKAEQKRLKEELTSTVAELEEINYKLAVLKAKGDITHGTPILFPTLGNMSMPGHPGDNVRDKQKELQDLEASHKEFTDLISKRLAEIKRLHEERIEILNKLATFQNTSTDFKSNGFQEHFFFKSFSSPQ